MKIADGGGNGLVVIGEHLRAEASSLKDKLASLDKLKVEARVLGDEQRGTLGSGKDVLGHPLRSLAWLVRHLVDRGEV